MNGSRYAFLDRICELVREGADIVVVSCDYAAPQFDSFRVEFPERFVSVGIAEQNMLAVSCGLALAGKRVVAYGLAPFPSLRAADQLKNAVSYMNAPINIVVSGAGFSADGITHSNTEDISFVRTLPNVKILTPTDSVLGVAAAENVLHNQKPTYIRFERNAEGNLYGDEEVSFEKGFGVLKDGGEIAVISNGNSTLRALSIVKAIDSADRIKLIDLFALPFDEERLLAELAGIRKVLTIEEHVLAGGIGSVMAELFADREIPIPLQRMGIDFNGTYPDTFGNREHYLDLVGLSNADIEDAIKNL
jgi:transketolase